MLSRESTQKIIVLDSLTYAGNMKNLQITDSRFSFVHGDICNKQIVDELLSQVDVVVNFAAESHVDKSILDSKQFISSNIVGTHVLLESSLKNKINRYVQISTDEVYGSIEVGSWDENSSIQPNSPYSASKASGDLLVKSFYKTYGLHTNITRCTNNFGPRQFPEKLIPFFISRLKMGLQIPIYGDGKNIRDWLHVTDHCRAIEMVLNHGEPGEIYNIGGGVELDNLTLAKKLVGLLDAPMSALTFVPDRKGHDLRYSVDWAKINKLLGYFPTMDFEASLKQTVNWYHDNPRWWNSE
jgi:dTDP-glucose 4,6-dehydratase